MLKFGMKSDIIGSLHCAIFDPYWLRGWAQEPRSTPNYSYCVVFLVYVREYFYLYILSALLAVSVPISARALIKISWAGIHTTRVLNFSVRYKYKFWT